MGDGTFTQYSESLNNTSLTLLVCSGDLTSEFVELSKGFEVELSPWINLSTKRKRLTELSNLSGIIYL